jgi:hypothetical protein
LKEPVTGPQAGKKGVAGKKGGGRSEKCRVSSEQRRKTRRNSGVAMAVSGFDDQIHFDC